MASKLVVTCVRGGREGARFEFDQDVVTVGRRQDNDLAMDADTDRKASGRHAELRRSGNQWAVVDLGSTNGTFIRGKPVQGQANLFDGANVEFGSDGPVCHFRIVVDEALVAAEPEPQGSTGRTGIYRAMMAETAANQSRPLKAMIAVLSVLLVLGAIGAGVYIYLQKQETDDLRRRAEKAQVGAEELESKLDAARGGLADSSGKLAELRMKILEAQGESRTKLEKQAEALEKVKTKYEAQLGSQEKQLAALTRTGQASLEIAKKNERALFMLIAKTPEGLVGYCTAFAVTRDGILGTNAHCVRNLGDMSDQGVKTVARMNRHPERTYEVVKWKSHKDYNNKAFSADVALVKLQLGDEKLPVAVELAGTEELTHLAPGLPIYTMGFPGKVMNEKRPAADFRAAVISRLTDYDNEPRSGDANKVVWHSALTSKGTSGSPIFNANGRVVAVNNGGLSARRVYIKDAKTGAMSEDVAYDATGLNFGIRVDVFEELLK